MLKRILHIFIVLELIFAFMPQGIGALGYAMPSSTSQDYIRVSENVTDVEIEENEFEIIDTDNQELLVIEAFEETLEEEEEIKKKHKAKSGFSESIPFYTSFLRIQTSLFNNISLCEYSEFTYSVPLYVYFEVFRL